MRTQPTAATAAGRRPREPQQARSRARVERLLEAADGVLAADGYEGLTIRRLAAEAGVPIGTLYQFFTDKQAIVDALAHRHLAEFVAVMEDVVTRSERERWPDPVQTLSAAFIDLYRSHPGYLAIWTGRQASLELHRADEENNAALADSVRRVLIAQLGLVDTEALAHSCHVAVQVCDALLRYAFRNGTDGDAGVLAELVRVQRLYLADLVARHDCS